MWKDNFFFRNSNGFNVVNGKTRHQGMELSIIGYLTDWISISGDATLAKHTYSFNEIVGSAENNITSGSRVDSAPDTLSHMRLTFLPTTNAEVELEWRHVGSYFTNPGNTNKYQGHNIFITRVNYALEENINLFGRVDNIFNKKYADRADYAFGSERYFPGRPRTLFFGLSTSF
jgi:iron complex outermembrane receptor protein